ncbi:MAG: class C sortase [Ruminococcus sp.]|nr:class C sortase [Ruminococcus sp.]MBQ9472589.1 class C sortase [Ruminococcus sp.]
MKKTLPLIAVLLVFLIGVGILAYPLISSVVNNMAFRNESREYSRTIERMERDDIDELMASAKAYNDSLQRVILTDPFDEASYGLIGENYEESLNVDGNGLIGYVEIPKIDVNLPIYHGTSIEVLSKGAGHLEHTALPIGGKSTHSVISAHSAWPGQTFFDYLETLEIGDEFYIKVLDMVLKYEVDDINVVLPDQTRNLYVVEGEDYLTLLTCTPYSVNTHRLLVRGKRVPYEKTDEDTVITDSSTFQEGFLYLFGYKLSYTVVAVSIIVFVVFVVTVTILIVRIRKFRSKKKGEEQ